MSEFRSSFESILAVLDNDLPFSAPIGEVRTFAFIRVDSR